MSINHALWNGKQYYFFVELHKTNCFHRLKISHWWTNRVVWRCLYFENIFLFLYHSQVQFAVFLWKIIPRNESFTEMLQMTHFVAMHPVQAEILPAVFTLKITNFTLIGYYFHFVNSSPLNWKQCRFVWLFLRKRNNNKLFLLNMFTLWITSVTGW